MFQSEYVSIVYNYKEGNKRPSFVNRKPFVNTDTRKNPSMWIGTWEE